MPKISVGESFAVAIIPGIEKVWIREAGEYHDFPSKYLSHCTDIFHWRTLWCCFRKILSSKIFMHRRGGITVFFGTFCLTVPKNFVGQPFSVSLISGTEKVWIRGTGEYQDFPSEIFCLTVPKYFIGEHFGVVSENFFYRKFSMHRRGGHHGFFRNFLSHSAEKFRRGTL